MSTSDLWAKCPECRHVWSIIKLPMEMEAAARAMIAAFCPTCGNDSPGLAPAADIPTAQQELNTNKPVREQTKQTQFSNEKTKKERGFA